MSELAQAYIAEVKLRGEVIQFLLGVVSLEDLKTQPVIDKVEAIKARYGRG